MPPAAEEEAGPRPQSSLIAMATGCDAAAIEAAKFLIGSEMAAQLFGDGDFECPCDDCVFQMMFDDDADEKDTNKNADKKDADKKDADKKDADKKDANKKDADKKDANYNANKNKKADAMVINKRGKMVSKIRSERASGQWRQKKMKERRTEALGVVSACREKLRVMLQSPIG